MSEPLNLKALRERLGWTQSNLAEYCDVDRATVSKWERNPPTSGPARILLETLVMRSTEVPSPPPASVGEAAE